MAPLITDHWSHTHRNKINRILVFARIDRFVVWWWKYYHHFNIKHTTPRNITLIITIDFREKKKFFAKIITFPPFIVMITNNLIYHRVFFFLFFLRNKNRVNECVNVFYSCSRRLFKNKSFLKWSSLSIKTFDEWSTMMFFWFWNWTFFLIEQMMVVGVWVWEKKFWISFPSSSESVKKLTILFIAI